MLPASSVRHSRMRITRQRKQIFSSVREFISGEAARRPRFVSLLEKTKASLFQTSANPAPGPMTPK